jgi:hypothetical protein
MSSTSTKVFYNTDHLSFDSGEVIQKNVFNDRFVDYTLTNYFSENIDSHIDFAMNQPNVIFNGLTQGHGLGSMVDNDTKLLIKTEQDRNCGKIPLNQRPFITVPFLGNGNVDCGVENDLKFGDIFREKKSVIQMMEMPFMTLDNYPILDNQVMISKATVDSQWMVGIDTREIYKNGESCKGKK